MEWPKEIPPEPMGYDEPVGEEPVLELEQYEKEIVADKVVKEFSGYFDYKELLTMINDWSRKNKYHRMLIGHSEKLTKTGRNIELNFRLTKQFTHIHVSLLNADLSISNMTTHYIEIDGIKKRVNKGTLELNLHSFLLTHLRSRWETKANIAFLRGIIDKFIYKLNRSDYPGLVGADSGSFVSGLSNFFSLWKKLIPPDYEEKPENSELNKDENKKE